MPNPAKLLSTPTPIRIGRENENLDLGTLIDYLIVGEGEAGLKSLAEEHGKCGKPRFRSGPAH